VVSADPPTTDDLARVLDAIDADTPPALEVAERLADATAVDVDTAQRVVWDAIDDGVLVEEGEGFGGVRLADDETAETANSDEKTTEEPGSRDETPTPETGETAVRDGDAADEGDDTDDGYHVSIPEEKIADHYERVRGVYERLATVDEYPTMGLDDLAGWYITKDELDVDALEGGYDKRRRPASFAKDLDTVLGRVDRSIYGLTTYKSPSAFRRWRSARLANGGYEYRDGESPTPLPEDLRAVSVWGDIDLTDELKGERGDLDDDTRATAEAALEAYAEEFATLVGGLDAVYGLDSVGGAYLFTAPETTLPIAEYVREEYGDDWVGAVLRELIDRSNEWLKDAQERVEERVDGAAEVIDPDWANNHNRKYKAPLSIHKDHDAVVTPIDVDDVEYSITPREDVTDDLVDQGERWAEEFTAREHTDRVATLVEHLFDGADDPDGWRDRVDAFVEDEREAERRREKLQRHREKTADRDLDLTEYEITPDIGDVEDAIDTLDIESVADETIVDKWTEKERDLTDRSGSEKKAIVPTWAGSYNSGNATYVDLEKGIFNDTDSGDHGTAVEMALIDREGWPVGKIADGDDWARGVQYLRELGYEIPVWTPDARANPDGDEMPYWALRAAAIALGVVDEDDLVDRDSETGEVVEDVDAHDGDTYRAFPPGAYAEAIDAVEDAGLDTGREAPDGDDSEEGARDLLDLDVVVEPANALAAAAAVEPSDLGADAELPELERDDVDDVAIAVALAEGWIESPSDFPSDGRYTEAYYRARDRYGAPLPKYLDNTTLEERDDLVLAALDRVRPDHILDGCRSEVTVDDPSGAAIAKLNPTWEDSESGERILAGYGAGFWCVEHEVSFSPIQLAALEEGLIDAETEYPRGEAFKQAYRVLREEYGAPLPKWRATVFEHVAVLPPSVRILDDEASAHAPSETLDEARERTEALIRDAVGVRGHAQVVTSLPGTGKTYGFTATSDDHPGVYLTRRNELKAQAEAYADEIREDEDHHPDAEPSVLHLPILAENTLPEEAVIAGVAAVREQGRELLRDGEALLDHVEPYLDDEDDTADEDDEVDLQRATCPTAEGEHGEAWRVRVLVARALKHTPAEIHRRDEALFGESIPCHHDSGECRYSRGWDRVRDPDNPTDLLVGSPEHAHVDSATTHFSRDNAGERVESARAVAIDEFPEDAYFSTYGERFMDHAVWLSEALTGVDSREDLLDAGLDTDTWVDLWLDGAGEEYGAAADAIEALAAAGDVAEASTAAAEILDEDRVEAVREHTSANVGRLRAALATLADADPEDGEALDGVVDDLGAAADRIGADADAAYADGRDGYGELYALTDDLEDLLQALTRGVDAVDTGEDGLLAAVEDRLDALSVGGDLRDLLDAAVAAVAGDAPEGVLDAATTALRGGRDGCRELALFANDGYAHPDAWALLAGAIADVGDDHVREVREATFSFDTEAEGGVFKRLEKNGATIAVDKNHHGALVVDPPAFTDAKGEKCPVLGLDATGRPELWRHAIGRDVQRRDIHDTDAQRRRFLREAVNLRVIQTSDTPLSYHSSPEGKNFQEDLALVEAVAEEYTGDADGAVDDKGPAVISTLKVVNHLEEELGAHAGEVVNYEGMKGSDALGEHQVAVILGSQHYSDVVPEKWALVAGEDAGRGDSHGAGLDYGSDVANAYLRHMREDHTMQAALRAGRNDEDTLVFAHTSALREDLPVVDEGAVVSAHSRGTLAVVEAAAEFRDGPFTAREVADTIADDDRAVGIRQVQNVLADLRDSGYLRALTDPHAGRAGEYELEEDPGLAEVALPDLEGEGEVAGGENEIPGSETLHTWNFAFDCDEGDDTGVVSPSTPVIPAGDTAAAVSDGVEPPG
jgi:hypothetical protein